MTNYDLEIRPIEPLTHGDFEDPRQIVLPNFERTTRQRDVTGNATKLAGQHLPQRRIATNGEHTHPAATDSRVVRNWLAIPTACATFDPFGSLVLLERAINVVQRTLETIDHVFSLSRGP